MVVGQPNRTGPRPGNYRATTTPPRRPVPRAGAEELGVRAAGVLFIASAVLAVLRVTLLKSWLPTEGTAGQVYGSAFVLVMLGVALLQGSTIAKRFVLVVATLGLLLILVALGFASAGEDMGPIVWLVASTIVAIPYVALLGLLVGEDHSRLRVGLCVGVLALYSLGVYGIEIGARRALEERTRRRIAEWTLPERALEEPALGVALDPPAGWVRLRPDSTLVAGQNGRAGFAHRATTAFAILHVEELRDGPQTARAQLDHVRQAQLAREKDVHELGVAPVTVGGLDAQKLTATWTAKDHTVRAWFVIWRDGWRYFTLFAWAPEARGDEAARAFAELERSLRFTPVVSKGFDELMQQVTAVAPHLSASAVRALLDRHPHRRLGATDVFRLAHRASLDGLGALTPAETEELTRLTAALYAGLSPHDRARLGAYQERVRQQQPTSAADDADMARAMKTGTDRLPPESLTRLQELLERTIAVGALMEAS